MLFVLVAISPEILHIFFWESFWIYLEENIFVDGPTLFHSNSTYYSPVLYLDFVGVFNSWHIAY
jgi:hypothetical protein